MDPTRVYEDRSRVPITLKDWKSLQSNPNYVILGIKQESNKIIIAEWLGISVLDSSETHPFRLLYWNTSNHIVEQIRWFTNEESVMRVFNANRKCPKCNAPMIIKQSTFGSFYGCTMWNKTGCKGKLSIVTNIPSINNKVLGPSKIRNIELD